MSHNLDTFNEYLAHCLALARAVTEEDRAKQKEAAEDFVLKVDQFVNAGGKSFTLGAPRLGSIKRPRSPDLVQAMKTAKQIIEEEDNAPSSPPPQVYIGYSNPINEALKHLGLPANTGEADNIEAELTAEEKEWDVALIMLANPPPLTLALPREFEEEYQHDLSAIARLYESGYGHVDADEIELPSFKGLYENLTPPAPRRVDLPRHLRNDHENDDDDDISDSVEY